MAIPYDGTDDAQVDQMIYKNGIWYYDLQSAGPDVNSKWVPYGQAPDMQSVITRIPKPQPTDSYEQWLKMQALRQNRMNPWKPKSATIVGPPIDPSRNRVDVGMTRPAASAPATSAPPVQRAARVW